jgi:UBX domain-containing protein 6
MQKTSQGFKMAFLKKFFDKVINDDDKYGKGHRLGDAKAAELQQKRQQEERAAAIAHQQAIQGQSSRTQSEAAQAAGQAAVARLYQRQQSASSSKQSQLMRKQIEKDYDRQDKELEKAKQLKDHYFGNNEVVIDQPVQAIEILFKSSILSESIRLPKKEIEFLIEQKLIDNINDEPVLTCLTLFLTSNYKTTDKQDKCLEILNKLVENIVKNPADEKYRKIRIENETIKQKLLTCKYIELLLDALGFKITSQYNEDLKRTENVYLFDILKIKNLEEFKNVQSYAKPIKPELDRSVKIFSSNENDTQPLRYNSLSEDFYTLSITELKDELKSREANLEKMQMLRTKAMRERDERLEQRKYIFCVIRIKFTNDLYLQAIFHTRETLNDLYLFIQSCLIEANLKYDLILPASTSLFNSNKYTPEMSLGEVGLAPASLLHFKCGELTRKNFLRDDLAFNY